VTHEVEDDEAAAAPADIANEGDELVVAQMMGETHANGDVGHGKPIANGVTAEDGSGRSAASDRTKIHADAFDTEAALHVEEKRAVAAADIKHAPNGNGVAHERTDDRRFVAEQAVSQREAAVSTLHQFGGRGVTIENLGVE